MADKDKKLITKDHLDSFFESVNIDLRGIINERNREQAKQAERRPGIGDCVDDNFEVKHSSKDLKESLNKILDEDGVKVETMVKEKIGEEPPKYELPKFKTEVKEEIETGCFEKTPEVSLPAEETRGPNILYLTTECNLACEYCYEQNERDQLDVQKVMTKQELSKALEIIHGKWNGEPGCPETVVIFGGEPFLEPESVKYILDRSLELDKNAFAFCLTTNGLWFLKEENVKKYLEWTKGRTVSLEVSWDGSGNYRRIYKNKKAAEKHIDLALDNISKYNIPVTLRYTIHAGNYDKVIHDYIYGIERWSNVKKIQNSYDYTGLDEIDPDLNWEQLIYGKLKYREFYKALWNKYELPLCQEVCDLCDYCDRTLTAVNYFVPEEDVLVKPSNKQGQVQNKPFDHWLKKDK